MDQDDAATRWGALPTGFVAEETAAFERWLAGAVPLVAEDLAAKHTRMRRTAFAFLRASYYLWLKRAPFAGAILIPSVGDAHAENFGTWRDVEDRLIYGVNDFDEVSVLPYDNDIVRLAASATLAPGHERGSDDVAKAVLAGYREGLAEPRPCLPDERDLWLRPHVAVGDRKRETFWREIDDLPKATPPADARLVLAEALPERASDLDFRCRRAGLGSLGKPRFVVVAEYAGGRILREAKAFAPSMRRHGGGATPDTEAKLTQRLACGAFRAPDPAWTIRGGWVLRRLTASSRKIELKEMGGRLADDLLAVMGRDLGAVHAASGRAADILADLDRRPKRWFRDATEAAAADVVACFEAFAEGAP